MEDLEQSVATHLNSIGLDHEEVLYVSAMLTDEDQETEEVEELVKGYLEAAAESADVRAGTLMHAPRVLLLSYVLTCSCLVSMVAHADELPRRKRRSIRWWRC